MTDDEYIKAGVDLADGWGYGISRYPDEIHIPCHPESAWLDDQYVLDALAAQLVRQVDALGEDWSVVEQRIGTDIYGPKIGYRECGWILYRGPDRTMNTIKAIVDSGVLK